MLNTQEARSANERAEDIMQKINEAVIQYGPHEWTLIMFDSKNGSNFEVISNFHDELSLASFKQILTAMVKMCERFESNERWDN
ncbi:MAG: hypothetical protein AB1610_08345 [Nitrospirota bacterium]